MTLVWWGDKITFPSLLSSSPIAKLVSTCTPVSIAKLMST